MHEVARPCQQLDLPPFPLRVDAHVLDGILWYIVPPRLIPAQPEGNDHIPARIDAAPVHQGAQ